MKGGVMENWTELNWLEKDEGEIVCTNCGNYNTATINYTFGFYRYDADRDYERNTILCRTCMISDGIIKDD